MTGQAAETIEHGYPHYFIGTSGWTYDDWKGRFYPADLPKKSWFDFYARQFNAVEVNATFYRFFKDETYQHWKERSPQDFGFVLKAPQLITHRKNLVDTDDDIKAFFRSCTLLGEKFKLILLQISPHISPDNALLQKALLAFPDPHQVVVEFRRPEWYTLKTLTILRTVGASICNTDSPQGRLTNLLTSDQAYLRLHGRRSWYLYNYSMDELVEIAGVASQLTQRGARNIYIFFNNDINANAPANALALRGLLEPA